MFRSTLFLLIQVCTRNVSQFLNIYIGVSYCNKEILLSTVVAFDLLTIDRLLFIPFEPFVGLVSIPAFFPIFAASGPHAQTGEACIVPTASPLHIAHTLRMDQHNGTRVLPTKESRIIPTDWNTSGSTCPNFMTMCSRTKLF